MVRASGGSGDRVRLGPIEVAGGEVRIGSAGDPARYLVLRADGVHGHEGGRATEFVPWRRVHEFGLHLTTLRARNPRRLGRILGVVQGVLSLLGAPGSGLADTGESCLWAALRAPYTAWSWEIPPPPGRGYRRRERRLAEALVAQVARAGTLPALGDADRLRCVLRELAGRDLRPWQRAAVVVRAALAACPPRWGRLVPHGQEPPYPSARSAGARGRRRGCWTTAADALNSLAAAVFRKLLK